MKTVNWPNQKERTTAINSSSLPMCQVPQCWSFMSLLKLKYVCMEAVQNNGSYSENLHPLVPLYLAWSCCFWAIFLAWKILTIGPSISQTTERRACHTRWGNWKVAADQSHTKQHKLGCVPKSCNYPSCLNKISTYMVIQICLEASSQRKTWCAALLFFHLIKQQIFSSPKSIGVYFCSLGNLRETVLPCLDTVFPQKNFYFSSESWVFYIFCFDWVQLVHG